MLTLKLSINLRHFLSSSVSKSGNVSSFEDRLFVDPGDLIGTVDLDRIDILDDRDSSIGSVFGGAVDVLAVDVEAVLDEVEGPPS